MQLILGSSSPRRREILRSYLPVFEIIHPDIDETLNNDECPDDYANRLSSEKAWSVFHKSKPLDEFLIIASDTIVAYQKHILGKPGSLKEACSMLELLSGNTHHVITSISLLYTNPKNTTEPGILTRSSTTDVTFKKLDDNIIKEYLDHINYSDKAGGYALQEYGDLIIEETKGSITNVIGFPITLFITMLNETGLHNILR